LASALQPALLWLVRHGESAGDVAERDGLHLIDISGRDMDVPLSPLGERQSRALGSWFGQKPEHEQPSVVMSSPYARAKMTAELVVADSRIRQRSLTFVVDERLREKEFGLNRFTRIGINAKFPHERRSSR